MRKWIIVVAVVIVVLCGAVALALANLNSFLNENKEWVASRLDAALGRNVTFEEVGVSILGGFGARVKKLSVSDDPAFSEAPFVQADDVRVSVKLLPALFGRYEVKSIELVDPKVTVVRTEAGFNFDSVGAPKKGAEDRPAEAAPPAAEPPPAPESRPKPEETAAFIVSFMEITDGEIHYVDRTAEGRADLTIRELDFTASDVSFTEPIEFAIGAALFGSDRQNFSLEGEIGPLGTPPQVRTAPLEAKLELDRLDVEALRKSVPVAAKQIPQGLGLSGPIELAGKLEGSLARLRLSNVDLAAAVFGAGKQNLTVRGALGPLGAEVPTSELELDTQVTLGPVAIDNLKKFPPLARAIPAELSSADPISLEATLRGAPERLKVQAKLDAENAALRYGSSFMKPGGTPLALALDAARAGEALDLASLQVRLAELELTAKGKVVTGERTKVDLVVDSNRAPLSGWDRLLPALEGHEVSGAFEAHVRVQGEAGGGQLPQMDGTLELAQVSAKRQGSPYEIDGLSTKIQFRGDTAVVPPTKFQLGGSPVELSANVASFRDLAASYVLRSPSLRLASLGLADPEAQKEEMIRGLESSGRFRRSGSSPEFEGNLKSSDGMLREFPYRDLAADFRLQNEVATLSKLSFAAFGGRYDGRGRYEMRGDVPKFDFQSVVRDMSLDELLANQRPGAERHIEGSLFADLALTGSGKEWERIKETLLGQGKVEVKDGALEDVNIAEGVLTGVTGVAGLSNLVSPRLRQKYPEIFTTQDTRFEKLGGTVQIANGEARTDDLTLAARDYTILGRGAFDFDNRLDFTATLVASRPLTEDVVEDVKEAKYVTNQDGRLAIPFQVAGALPNVRPKPDTQFIAQAIARAAVGKGIEKGLEKLLGERGKDAAPREKRRPKPEDVLKKGLEELLGR